MWSTLASWGKTRSFGIFQEVEQQPLLPRFVCPVTWGPRGEGLGGQTEVLGAGHRFSAVVVTDDYPGWRVGHVTSGKGSHN